MTADVLSWLLSTTTCQRWCLILIASVLDTNPKHLQTSPPIITASILFTCPNGPSTFLTLSESCVNRSKASMLPRISACGLTKFLELTRSQMKKWQNSQTTFMKNGTQMLITEKWWRKWDISSPTWTNFTSAPLNCSMPVYRDSKLPVPMTVRWTLLRVTLKVPPKNSRHKRKILKKSLNSSLRTRLKTNDRT